MKITIEFEIADKQYRERFLTEFIEMCAIAYEDEIANLSINSNKILIHSEDELTLNGIKYGHKWRKGTFDTNIDADDCDSDIEEYAIDRVVDKVLNPQHDIAGIPIVANMDCHGLHGSEIPFLIEPADRSAVTTGTKILTDAEKDLEGIDLLPLIGMSGPGAVRQLIFHGVKENNIRVFSDMKLLDCHPGMVELKIDSKCIVTGIYVHGKGWVK